MKGFSESNIDQWLFDYFEGNLSSADEQLVEQFLIEYPEYASDMDAWAMSSVSPIANAYPNAEKIKKRRFGFIFWMQSSAALLLLLIFVGAYFLIQPFEINKQNESLALLTNQTNNPTNLFLTTINNLALAQQKKNASTNSVVQLASANNLKKEKNKINTAKNTSAKYFLPTTATNQPNRQFLSNSHQLKNDLRKTEKLTAATSRLLSENSTKEFSEEVLKMKPQLSAAKNIEIETRIIQSKILEEDNSNLVGANKKEAEKTHRWLNKFSRKVKNFLHREVALRNLRDPMYIVPGLTQRDVNFANTGGALATRVQSFNRVQWAGTNNQTVDMQLAADGYVHALHGGVGLQVKYSNFNAGLLQNYEAALTYSPKFKLGKNFVLEPAVRFKMGTKNLNNTKFNPGQQTEWNRGIVNTFASNNATMKTNKLWYKDLGFGLMLNAKWFFVGMNLDNITRHRENLYSGNANALSRTPLNFTATVGTDYQSFNKKVSLSTYLVYQNYGTRNEGWLGATFRYSWLTLGGAVSTNLDPAASIGLKFNRFMLTYSMDYVKNIIDNKRYLSGQLLLRFTMRQTKYGRTYNF